MAGVTSIVMGVVSLGVGLYQSEQANALAEENMALQESQAQDVLQFQKEQQFKLDQQKQIYRNMVFKNPYENMENVYEDLTINQQQADFERQMFEQSQANIMQGLQGAAGGSGIAGLAQAMANQGQLASQRASASIGAQEAQNIRLAAQGAGAADMAERGGEQYVQDLEASRQSTLLGVAMGESAGANASVQQAYANQMAAGTAQASAMAGQASASFGMAGQFMGMAGDIYTANTTPLPDPNLNNTSDRKLKKNINKIGKSPSGLNIYSFEFKDSKYGKGLFQGVMSDEIPQEAVVEKNGYDTVNYNMLDVEFKQI